MNRTQSQIAALAALTALSLPPLQGCAPPKDIAGNLPPVPASANDVFPEAVAIQRTTIQDLYTEKANFTQNHMSFLGERVTLPVSGTELQFIEELRIGSETEGQTICSYNFALGVSGWQPLRAFASAEITNANAVSGIWRKHENGYYLAVDRTVSRTVIDGQERFLWQKLDPIPESTIEIEGTQPIEGELNDINTVFTEEQ